MRLRIAISVTCFRVLMLAATPALAGDIPGVQPAALDQPRVNAALTLGPINTGTLLTADFGGGFVTFNVEAFLDTGASGVLLSSNTADYLGINRATFGGQSVVFSDVGVVGSDTFNVSEPLHINLAPYAPGQDLDNPATYKTVYTQPFGPIRAQVGPLGAESDPVLGDLDVFGVPVMHNKVVVINPRPVNTFVDTMRTAVYNFGDGAIPATSLHISLSKADFSPYTQVTPAGADGPTLNANPFIGPDPTHPGTPGPPPISLSYQGHQTNGSFLLDTGAAASMISKSLAASLGVTYDPNASNPTLLYNGQPVPNQFTLTIGGIGGTTKVAGFFLDALKVPTVEGGANDLNFTAAPVLVTDITVRNPLNGGTLTLDGIFGMNYLVASANIIESEPLPTISALTRGPFDMLVYDDQNGVLGVEPAAIAPDVLAKAWFAEVDNPQDAADWDRASNNWFDPDTGDFGKYADGDDVQFPEFSFFTVSANVQITTPVAPKSVTIDNSAYSYRFSGAAITGDATVFKLGTATATFANSNTYTGLTDIEEGTFVFEQQQDIGPVLVRSAGTLIMQASEHLDGLRLVNGKAKLTAGGTKLLRTTSLDITGTGQLDLADNKLIIDNKAITTPDDLRRILKAGRANGAWNGPGLVSSTAAAGPLYRYSLGYADNAVLERTTFGGESVDAQSLLVRFTYTGDANLDGQVDIRDLRALATHWKDDDSFWHFGDFNYDGNVDGADLGLLARNWQQGVGNPLAAAGLDQAFAAVGMNGDSVPEPFAGGAWLCCLMIATSIRPRSHRRVYRL